jgi:hypothetical protein
MPFVSFISYARVNRTRYVEKFVRELSQQVVDKTGANPNDVAFFDKNSIATGQDWARLLGDALRTSKVIVCICTPHYLSSEFCGKELKVFLLRRENWLQRPENAARKAGIVFPIIWERPAAGLPKPLAKFQFDEAAFPKKYVESGLNALAMVSRERDNFLTVVIRLAERIRDAIAESELPEWPSLPAFEQIPNLFNVEASAASYQYAVTFLHKDGRAWKPFGGPVVSELPDFVAAHTNRLCREIPSGVALAAELTQAQQRREAVAILTDTDTLDDPARAADLAALDAALPDNCALIVLPGAAGPDTAALDRARSRFPKVAASSGPHNWGAIRSQSMLVTELVRSLESIGSALVRSDPAAKFDDPTVRAAARSAGRELDVAPTVLGPGGGK